MQLYTFRTIFFLLAYSIVLFLVFLFSTDKENQISERNIYINEGIYISHSEKWRRQNVTETKELTLEEQKYNYEKSTSELMREIIDCKDTIQKLSIKQNGDYWILYNYVVSETQFQCSETITYVTHGDYTFLDNIVPVVTRWMGPISMAIYAPGDDFQKTVESIRHLRQCGPQIVAKFVTFHIYFNNDHMPAEMLGPDYWETSVDCEDTAPYLESNGTKTYKAMNNMTYPVNLGRNIARNGAQTHFLLVSDIELYPSKDIVPKFLDMVARNKSLFGTESDKMIFPIPIFEVEKDQNTPETKTQLQELLRKKKAVFFHQKTCPKCHRVPKLQEWINATETSNLNIFHTGKRTGDFKNWEPIFIGTNQEPFYEERQSWEGMSDKMTQAYALCALDYDLMVLDNVFLCHKPGIKYKQPPPERYTFMSRTFNMIHKKILPELKILYGEREGCEV